MNLLNLVADIGGTNSRYALCESGSLHMHEPRKLLNAEYGSLEESLAHYLSETGATPQRACLAVAGPVTGDHVRLTNIDWQFSREALQKRFGLRALALTNDFTALAMAVPHLPGGQIIKAGGGEPAPHQPIAVVGPGTGLGASGLIWCGTHWVPLQGEGGNVAFAPGSPLEVELLGHAMRQHDYVRAEHFISGYGMSYLHKTLAAVKGISTETLKAEEITRMGLNGECSQCEETLLLFCGMLGSFAGDLSLILGARGGVYIGGGIVTILGDFFLRSPFRARFEAKGKFTEYVRPIPTYVMRSFTEMALIGAASILHTQKD